MQPGPSLDHFVAPSHHGILRPFLWNVGSSQILGGRRISLTGM